MRMVYYGTCCYIKSYTMRDHLAGPFVAFATSEMLNSLEDHTPDGADAAFSSRSIWPLRLMLPRGSGGPQLSVAPRRRTPRS